jgi:dihydrofolate reductase
MRKVAGWLFSSLDGVVEAPNEWQFDFDDQMGEALNSLQEEQDTILLGRVTYSEWVGYWPKLPADSPDISYADWINNTPKYVFSTTLASVDEWPNSRTAARSPPRAARRWSAR